MISRNIQLPFFFVLLGLTLVFSFFILKPYVTTLVLAGACAVVFQPLYRRFNHSFNHKVPSIAAMLTVIVAGLIVLVPTGFVGTRVFYEARGMYQNLSVNELPRAAVNPEAGGIENFSAVVRAREYLEGALRYGLEHLNAGANEAFGWVLSNAGDFSRRVGQFGIRLGIWVFAFYYLLRDGGRLRRSLISLSPLSDKYDNELVDRIISAVKSVLGGSLIVALLQGALCGIGMWIFGLPAPALWGLIAAFAALIPSVGTALVLLPAAGYLFIFVGVWPAIGLALWGLTLVNVVDNILRPKLIERGIHVHPLLILLSVLGGIKLLGPVGFLIGPIVISVLVEFVEIYNKMILHHRHDVLTSDNSKS